MPMSSRRAQSQLTADRVEPSNLIDPDRAVVTLPQTNETSHQGGSLVLVDGVAERGTGRMWRVEDEDDTHRLLSLVMRSAEAPQLADASRSHAVSRQHIASDDGADPTQVAGQRPLPPATGRRRRRAPGAPRGPPLDHPRLHEQRRRPTAPVSLRDGAEPSPQAGRRPSHPPPRAEELLRLAAHPSRRVGQDRSGPSGPCLRQRDARHPQPPLARQGRAHWAAVDGVLRNSADLLRTTGNDQTHHRKVRGL